MSVDAILWQAIALLCELDILVHVAIDAVLAAIDALRAQRAA